MNLLLAGDRPLLDDLAALCALAGHTVAAYSADALAESVTAARFATAAAGAEVAIECSNGSRSAKRRLLEPMGAPSDGAAPLVLICAQACSTTEAASWLPRPEAACGWSALPPLVAGDVVELARGLRTSKSTAARAADFWRKLGLEVVEVADGPGLVRARVLCCLINEAAATALEGVASPADIDLAMRLGTNYPRGPLAWGDLLGLDTVLGVLRGLYEEYAEDRYRPSPLLTRYVQAGWLGKKTGRGFFEYEAGNGKREA